MFLPIERIFFGPLIAMVFGEKMHAVVTHIFLNFFNVEMFCIHILDMHIYPLFASSHTRYRLMSLINPKKITNKQMI
jgi:hypothetical protein